MLFFLKMENVMESISLKNTKGNNMEVQYLKTFDYIEIKAAYKSHLINNSLSSSTINTMITDALYIWRNGSKDLFWEVVQSNDFELKASETLENLLKTNSKSDIQKSVKSYMSHLRRFCLFLDSNVIPKNTNIDVIVKIETQFRNNVKKQNEIVIPKPSKEEIDKYLLKWKTLDDYSLQEDALDKLFFILCKKNENITDILLKSSTLNDFYSTNIFKIYPLARHILSLDIDSRLKNSDVNLVKDIQYVKYGNVVKNFYSFATKYCSHHNPLEFPIYDSYVDLVLRYFRKRDEFSLFQDTDLKDYAKFKNILLDFQMFYGLSNYNLKQIDQYLWLLGKDYFPKKYKKNSKV